MANDWLRALRCAALWGVTVAIIGLFFSLSLLATIFIALIASALGGAFGFASVPTSPEEILDVLSYLAWMTEIEVRRDLMIAKRKKPDGWQEISLCATHLSRLVSQGFAERRLRDFTPEEHQKFGDAICFEYRRCPRSSRRPKRERQRLELWPELRPSFA